MAPGTLIGSTFISLGLLTMFIFPYIRPIPKAEHYLMSMMGGIMVALGIVAHKVLNDLGN